MSLKLTIIMPTLNSARFLESRMESIYAQSLTDWELIVVDSHSTDGTWELMEQYSRDDSRLRLFQMPREGIYPALNFALSKVRCRYIYIATSDDTMFPNCLKRMYETLEKHPECDICHSNLQVIDQYGVEIPNWWSDRPATLFYGELGDKTHIRLAPYDGILHICLNTVYGSLTQLLIRKTAFDKIGFFRSDWGPRGDFEWGMRAGTVCNTIHLPEVLATWRIHEAQLTSPPKGDLLCEMVKSALPLLRSNFPDIYDRLNLFKLCSYYERLAILQKIKAQNNLIKRFLTLLTLLIRHPYVTPQVVYMVITNRNVLRSTDKIHFIRKHLKQLGLSKKLITLVPG